MWTQRLHPLDFSLWTPWLPWIVGIMVTFTVGGFVALYGRWRWRRRRLASSREEDLPWQDLLEVLQKRKRDRAAAGLPPETDVPAEEMLAELLASLPPGPRSAPPVRREDLAFLAGGGDERRGSPRRWGNPTEIHLTLPVGLDRVHGLVVNRSTGGLGIFADRDIAAGTTIRVRPVEAPAYIPEVEVEVRHSRKISKGFLLGCQFLSDVPWNVRVWFG
jgi:hypothetical protein